MSHVKSFWLIKLFIIAATLMNLAKAYATIEIHPYLSFRNNPCDSIVINWWNLSATGDSSVDYGLTVSYGSVATNSEVSNFHHVELTGLLPATTYHYRIRSSDGTIGQDSTFTTSAINPGSFSFAVYGDPRGIALPADSTIYHTRHKQLCDWLSEQDINFVLELGDIVWDGAIRNYDPQAKIRVETYYTEFFKAEQNLAKSKPIMATMGGHEVQPGGTDYVYYFDMYEDAFPTNGPIGNKGRIYSFDYGNAHFICLSSYQISLAAQATWLEADLAAARANPNIKWIFVFMHAPMYTTSDHSGSDQQIAYWGPLFDEYHVDVVFASHNHVYERFHPIKNGQIAEDGNGTVYITNGLGGSEFNEGASDPKLFCWFGASNLNKTLGLIITVDGNNLIGQAIPNLTGIAVDSFQISKFNPQGDFNKNGIVDLHDLKILSNNWLSTGIWPNY